MAAKESAHPRETTRYIRVGLLAAVPFAFLIVCVEAGFSWLLDLDDTVNRATHRLAVAHPVLVDASRAASTIGGPGTFYVLTAAIGCLLLWRSTRVALWIAVTMAGAAVLDKGLKAAVGRARPSFSDPVAIANGHSFPSGHTLASVVGCGVILLVVLPLLTPRTRPPAMVAAVVVALLVGLSRIGLGVHYLSDVIGGWLLGIAWLSVTLTAFAIGGRNAARTDGCAAHPSVFLLGTVACLTLLTGMPVSR